LTKPDADEARRTLSGFLPQRRVKAETGNLKLEIGNWKMEDKAASFQLIRYAQSLSDSWVAGTLLSYAGHRKWSRSGADE
jgi:hypothetical protein